MNFQNLTLRREYRSSNSDIVNEFYIPLLNNSVLYRRAVGFFSSTSLAEISKGITGLIKNNGRIELIASPKLSEEDIEAIRLGYKLRNEIIEERLISELRESKDYFESERLNALAHLIANDRLNIKIALLNKGNEVGIYHEKLGIIYDNNGNKVVFTGSLNETSNALKINYESIDVFTSWNDRERVEDKEKAFCSIWENRENGLEVLEFPKVKAAILEKYKREKINFEFEKNTDFLSKEKRDNEPSIPYDLSLHDYQKEAIDEWQKRNFKGIFDMATGTGKTFTALGAIERISKYLNNELGVIIVCPYQHLVEQWAEDVRKFNIDPIIAYSASSQKDWKRKLDRSVRDQKLGVTNKKFFCILTTNATYSGEYIQKQILKMKGNLLLVVDEAHNFGASSLKSKLHEKFQYRLALSATLERHNDIEGTKAIYDYFGEKCIEYSLEKAIEQGYLTKYKYYPIIVTLTEEERNLYDSYTKEIIKCIKKDKRGKRILSQKGKIIALKRSKVIAGAVNKIAQLKEDIIKYKNDNHILIYCGATKVLDENKDYTDVDSDDIRQIDLVTRVLGNDLNMKVAQFTSQENMNQRAILKDEFFNGENLQALIAIKCLDEGVNIPSIKTAFILASTSNPKEYIQRRGRVLRLSPGKEYAEIYDYVTMPRKIDEVMLLTEERKKRELSLVKNELKRAEEFARLADNSISANAILDEIYEAYELLNISFEECGDDFDE